MSISISAATPVSRWGQTVAAHWPEYTIEGVSLAVFMVSACIFGTLLAHPDSPVVQFVHSPDLRRVLMGVAMGATSVALVYTRFGKRSGAHLNPATTLTFFRLGKIATVDVCFYVAAQFTGAAGGVFLASIALGRRVSHPAVNYVVTQPGRYGYGGAFIAEVVITFLLMSVILRVSNTPRINRYTGIVAGLFVMTYISVEAPISGMSMNPARTFGSALSAGDWMAIWIYFTGPPLGMLMAAELFIRSHGAARVLCAKLHHENQERCIFRCGYPVVESRISREVGSSAERHREEWTEYREGSPIDLLNR
jgi:aquaporin Z